MLKKSVLVVALLLVTTNVWAALVKDVSATKHNLSSGNLAFPGYASGNEDEVCIYCHTPHGGSLNAPLWNRALTGTGDGSGFTHYTSSTLSSVFSGQSGRTVRTESLLCMTCHDGSVAMGTLINISNRTGVAPDNVAMMGPIFPGFPSAQVGEGGDLTQDHPVSFSYYDAWNLPANSGKLKHADGVPVNDPRAKGVRLFGLNQALGQRVECSSCHDPHVNGNVDAQYLPFLVMSNAGSGLCLACHIK